MSRDLSPVVGDRRLAAYAQLLDRIERMGAGLDPDALFDQIAAYVREMIPFDAFSIWRYDAADQMIRKAIWHGPSEFEADVVEAPVDFGPAGRAILTQQPVELRLSRGPAPPIAVLLRDAGFRVMCVVPASTPTTHWGLIGIASRDVDEYPAATIDILKRIADRVARAAAPAPQPGAAPRPEAIGVASPPDAIDRTQLLLRITNAVTSQRHLPALLETISSLLRETIPHHYASLSIWDEDTRGLRRWAAVQPVAGTPLPEGVLLDRDEPPWLAFESGDVIQITPDALLALDTAVTPSLVARGLRSGVCLPLKTPRGKYGVLNVGSPRPDAFSLPEIMLLWQIARQLALAIENAIYFDRAERYRFEARTERDRFKLLLDVNNALVSQLDARQLWQSVFETVRRDLHHDYASLVILDRASGTLQLEAATYYDARGILEPQAPMLERSPVAQALEGTVPCVFSGEELDRLDLEGVSTMRSTGLQSACCIPLATRGRALGVLNVASRTPGAFSQADVDLLSDIAGQIAIAVENVLAVREISELKNRLAEEKLYLEGEVISQHDFKEIVGESQALRHVLQQIQTVAATDATVLLLGETGTGKELLARALHDASRRRDHPFIRLSGAALPTSLIESELFGYEKGAFTGAVQSRAGRLELAHRGTLFLDEVGDIPLEVQPKLLRVLQEREFERLGTAQTRRVDVRLVAATNRNLDDMVAAGSFRSDLYYRLSVFPIHVPPLRERRGDIPMLVRHFVQKASRAMGRHVTTIPKTTMDALERWHWPGNIRELQNVIERAVILTSGSVLHVPIAAIPVSRRHSSPSSGAEEARYRSGERAMIVKALAEAKGVIGGPNGAAARLGLKRTTLQSKMQRLGIKP
jgi:formate hydrogenlyase transcriptional activator